MHTHDGFEPHSHEVRAGHKGVRRTMQRYDHTRSVWSVAAERWLRRALSDVLDGKDAIPAVDAALAALRIEAGELPEDEGLLDAPEPDDIACGQADETGAAP